MVELNQVAVVVLAAGLSRRFGSDDKLLAHFDGRPLADHSAETLSRIRFGHHIAVCKEEPNVTRLFASRGFSIVSNHDSARGQASSLALGVAEAARRDAAFVLICLADMPRVSADHLLALLGALGKNPAGIAASAKRVDASPTPPAVFGARHFSELMQLTGDEGARHLLRQASIVVAPPHELADFDTPADFS